MALYSFTFLPVVSFNSTHLFTVVLLHFSKQIRELNLFLQLNFYEMKFKMQKDMEYFVAFSVH
jgi:hypothetical protein